ncbi:MAG: apiosidase-like domain-containing protein, partial [Planctomycetota bacterium]
RRCVTIAGADGASLNVSPCHPVALKGGNEYVLTGRFKEQGGAALGVEMTHDSDVSAFEAHAEGAWMDFACRFVAGENVRWLGRLALRKTGPGTIWIDNLSLKEAGGGAELLWEADVNRPARGFYNQIDCFLLDELVEAAEENGIYLMLCLITRDLYMKSLSDAASDEYKQAVRDAKNLIRYAVARWGYSTSVAVWEYFNEIDPRLPTDRFYDEVGEYLEEIDPYRHLRTTSTWHPSAKDCRHGRLDIGQLHHYMRPETEEDYRDEVAVLIDKTRFLREHTPGKPVLIGEFGLANPKWGLSEDMKRDTEGVHFHNCLWASAFAGSSGTAMFWWWDQLDRQDMYHHYRPLSAFLADVSLAGLQPVDATASDSRLRLVGYSGTDRAYLWLADSSAIWWNLVVDRQEAAKIKDAAVEIAGLDPGVYRVTWWHTLDGRAILSERISLAESPLRISVPAFARDIACKIVRAR